jgi:hypothetical protein
MGQSTQVLQTEVQPMMQKLPGQEIQQLLNTIKDLEARLSQLEQKLLISADTKTLTICADTLELKTDSSTITLRPTGIALKANDITLAAAGRISVRASSDLVLKGSKILQN